MLLRGGAAVDPVQYGLALLARVRSLEVSVEQQRRAALSMEAVNCASSR